MLRSREGGTSVHAGAACLAASVILAACAGSNLFDVAAVVGGGGPTVQITAPTDGVTVAQGASLPVSASVEAPDGLSSATISGVFSENNVAAFAQQTITYGNVPTAQINQTLASTNAGTGTVFIIASVTDAGGETAADTVSITVN